MKSYDASGDGFNASSARTQSRQRVEQNLLADIRWPCARVPADIVSFSWPSRA
jgi:hypothetical protein